MVADRKERIAFREYAEAFFWKRTQKKSDDECWKWIGTVNPDGYGNPKIRLLSGRFRSVSAHRLSYALFRGKISKRMCVCHTCDNPSCVNPAHLWLGTHQENIADRDRKGRHVPSPGSKHGNSKLTEDQVLEIRRLYSTGDWTQRKLAECFLVSREAIAPIVQGTRWKHVSGEIGFTRDAKLTDAQVLEIRKLYAGGGWTHSALAANFEVSEGCIFSVVRGKTYKDVSGPIMAARSNRGSGHVRAKLTEESAAEIRRLHDNESWGKKDLAALFKVSWRIVHRVVLRQGYILQG